MINGKKAPEFKYNNAGVVLVEIAVNDFISFANKKDRAKDRHSNNWSSISSLDAPKNPCSNLWFSLQFYNLWLDAEAFQCKLSVQSEKEKQENKSKK